MNIKEMKELDKYLHILCDNRKFTKKEEEELDSIIARASKDIGFICKVTKRNLIKHFGEHKLLT